MFLELFCVLIASFSCNGAYENCNAKLKKKNNNFKSTSFSKQKNEDFHFHLNMLKMVTLRKCFKF